MVRIDTPFLVHPRGGVSLVQLLRAVLVVGGISGVLTVAVHPMAGVVFAMVALLGGAFWKDRRDAGHARAVTADIAAVFGVSVPVQNLLHLMRGVDSGTFDSDGVRYELEYDVEPDADNDYRLPRIAIAAV